MNKAAMRKTIIELQREKRAMETAFTKAELAHYARLDALDSELRRVEIALENAEAG